MRNSKDPSDWPGDWTPQRGPGEDGGGSGPPSNSPSAGAAALDRIWNWFHEWWYAPEAEPSSEPYDPQVRDPFPGPGDAGGESLPGGLDDDACFVGDTPVLMADGLTKPISAVVIGDLVMGRDERTGMTGAGAVAQVFRHDVAETLTLTLDKGEVVETTAAHRFGAQDGGFVSAGDLRAGDHLATREREGVRLLSVVRRSTSAVVFNLSVERYQTFFVGRPKLWVHNRKKSDPYDPDSDPWWDWDP